MEFTFGILSISREPAAKNLQENALPVAVMLEKAGYRTGRMESLFTEQKDLEKHLISWADEQHLDLIVTMGGVSLKPEDTVPEATEAVCSRMIPGIGEAMRTRCYQITPRAILSRGTAGIRGKTIILNLPGRAGPAMENLEPILPVLGHALEMLSV